MQAAAATLRRSGRPDKAQAILQSDAPEFPLELDYLWRTFFDVAAGFAVTGMAIPTLTWEGLLAYEQLTDVSLDPWERRLLMQISVARAHALAWRPEKKSEDNDGRKLSRRSDRARG